MRPEEQPTEPSWPWRAASAFTMGTVGVLCRSFLYGLSTTHVEGLDEFLQLLDERQDPYTREKGLITVSNHISVLDDPLMWGVLPLRYLFNPSIMRWGLASYDLCFTNKGLSTFFTLGQLLPTHRSQHSTFGGLGQPTVTQAIRLLSRGPFLDNPQRVKPNKSLRSPDLSDPFSGGHLTFSTDGVDTFPAPAAYASRRHAWVHIFPEGRIHQTEEKTMRYFKWGISRLLLESEPCPDVVPIWLEGPDKVMDERRGFPKPLPRPGKEVFVAFGKKIDGEQAFGDLRARWKKIREKEEARSGELPVGVLNDALLYDEEAVRIREECTMRCRNAVLAVRRTRGYPDEDPKASFAATWAIEGSRGEGKKDDGSIVKDQ
ncbi:hypothetical protein M011DRAFT_452408 [Sporormia fimetaria CBS 119925]|uniref:Tafazzin family protein n=1 Tax=Sporormia fimetaria CBS 119925 TaxID=1340428 RepID=A0A6A6V0L3_9PLEO|nr:hypothetical protein M011DRAFT_452408 [Sporormia fimetaria CBS 119925]